MIHAFYHFYIIFIQHSYLLWQLISQAHKPASLCCLGAIVTGP